MKTLVAILLLFSVNAHAAEPIDLGFIEWKPTPAYLKEGMAGRFHTVLDVDSSYRVGDLVYFWLIQTRVSGKGRVHQIKAQHIIDCEQRTYAVKAIKELDKDGTLIKQGTVEQPDWDPISPGSRGLVEFDHVCN